MGLKAELLRKKEEVQIAKSSGDYKSSKKQPREKLRTKLDKANEGVCERQVRDAEEIQEESDMLKRSRDILEAKSKLYDHLAHSGFSGSKSDRPDFLVDFEQKEAEENPNEESDKVESDFYDSDDEWVDFVDCLGRTKRCLREDLAEMKLKDGQLKVSLQGPKKEAENPPQEKKMPSVATVTPELQSEDMKRDELRKKWEEQEILLLNKKDIHYQDVLFDGKSFFFIFLPLTSQVFLFFFSLFFLKHLLFMYADCPSIDKKCFLLERKA